jgi:hypothetical protein
MPFHFVVHEPVITVSYDAIIWPQSILTPHGSLFKLGRLVKSFENAMGRLATEAELEFVFDRWCLSARRFWRAGHTRDDYYAEFLNAYSYARIGLDHDPIELAVSRARARPWPQVRGFTDERVRLLVAICREMQSIMGATPFFLPTRKLGEILGVHYSRTACWLRALETLRIIHLAPGEVRRRGGNRCPRYHYGAPTQNSVGFVATAPLSPSEHNALPDGYQRTDAEGSTNFNSEVLLTTR